MKTTLISFIILFSGLNVMATAQSPDKIIYDGKEYSLFSNPLESFFKINPDKRPSPEIISTGLWRGYVATFEVRQGRLYLEDIEIQVRDTSTGNSYHIKWISVLGQVFPNKKDIVIDWLTGLLVIPDGELVNYVHMGYGSTYEKYILLEVRKGEVKKEKRFNHKEYEDFKDKQFETFKQTEAYRKKKADLQRDGKSSDEFVDSFLRSFVTEYTSKILTE